MAKADDVKLIYGDNLPRQEGETAQEWQARRTQYDDEVKHFVGVFPDQEPFKAETQRGINHCEQYGMGEPIFYCSIEGTPDNDDAPKVVSVAWPDTPIKYRTRAYDGLKLAAGNIVANFQERSIDLGYYVTDPHPFLSPTTRAKNDELLEEARSADAESIANQLAKM